LNITDSDIKTTIKNFKGVEHRQEHVLIKNGVNYINDSKSTNINSVIVAIKTFKQPLIVLLGGYNKGSHFEQLLPVIKTRTIKYFICYGDAGELIESALGDAVRSFLEIDLSSAVLKAQTLAIPGDTVLLSPGCASFDEFNNYEDRGNFFKKLIVDKD
jgi:UDP-N-acetylmuramoylalanine--D-glutamate ligase